MPDNLNPIRTQKRTLCPDRVLFQQNGFQLDMLTGWLKNKTKSDQSWGTYTVPANGVGLVPLTVLNNLRSYPQKDLVVIEDNPQEWCFHRTAHRPWSARYDRHRGQD